MEEDVEASRYGVVHVSLPWEWSGAACRAAWQSSQSGVPSGLPAPIPAPGQVPISENTAVRYLKEMNFSYKRYLYALKKCKQMVFERASEVIGELGRLDREQRCALLYFDES